MKQSVDDDDDPSRKNAAVDLREVSHRYTAKPQPRLALRDLTLSINRGEIFGFLGPNGSGKTTLFRLLSTLAPLQHGRATLLGLDLRCDAREVRRRIGVVFQSPSVDVQLTVAENIHFHSALYGLSRRQTKERMAPLVASLGLEDRLGERVQTLSGGLRRRVELAKGMIHQPQLLLMDEPSSGLDPGARSDLWRYLSFLQRDFGVTVMMTTHLLEEAEKADRIAILHEGSLTALDTPAALRASVGGDTITLVCDDPQQLCDQIHQQFNVTAKVVGATLRMEQPRAATTANRSPITGQQWVERLVDSYGERIQSITLSKPTLEDVFILKTGRRFWNAPGENR